MSGDVILFPVRRQPKDRLRDDIHFKVRLEKDLPHAFAANLGRLAAQLNPGKPSEGARRMFDRVFSKDSAGEQWRRRKRLIRLPGEEAAPSEHARDYEARGQNYVLLSEAFAELNAPGSANARRQAIQELVRGTRLDPHPGIHSGFEGLEQARSILRLIAEEVAADNVAARAFRILRQYPVAAMSEQEFEDEFMAVRPNMMAALRCPTMKDGFCFLPSQAPAFARDYEVSDYNQIPWSIPRVFLGYAYEPKEFETYSLPDPIIDPPEGVFELRNLLTPLFAPIMESEPAEIRQGFLTYGIYAAVFPDQTDQPTIVLFAHSEPDFVGDQMILQSIERKQVLARRNSFDDEVVAEIDGLLTISGSEISDPEDLGYWVFKPGSGILSRFTAMKNSSYDELWTVPFGSQTVADDDLRHILAIGAPDEDRFKAVVWDLPTLFAKAPQLSVAATIIRNNLHAPPGERIADALIQDIHLRLKPLLNFMDGEIQEFDEANGAQ